MCIESDWISYMYVDIRAGYFWNVSSAQFLTAIEKQLERQEILFISLCTHNVNLLPTPVTALMPIRGTSIVNFHLKKHSIEEGERRRQRNGRIKREREK